MVLLAPIVLGRALSLPLQVGGGNLRDMAYAEDNPYRTSSR